MKMRFLFLNGYTCPRIRGDPSDRSVLQRVGIDRLEEGKVPSDGDDSLDVRCKLSPFVV